MVCRASDGSRRASGIVVSGFFSFEEVMSVLCRKLDVDDDDNDDEGLVRRTAAAPCPFVVTALPPPPPPPPPTPVGIERNLSLPRG